MICGKKLHESWMRLGGINIEESNRSNAFAEFFDEKVKKTVLSCKVDNNVYNGQQKVNCVNDIFMTLENVFKAMKSIKIKNSEGYDRIPQRIFNEGLETLLIPVHKLLNLI